MFDHPLSLAMRGSVTLTALVFGVVVYRVVFRRAPRAWILALGGAFVGAAAFSHVGPLTELVPRAFPVGVALGRAAVLVSLGSARARRAFDAASDGEMRMLLAFRAMFGAMLFALAAIGHMPTEFALAAGLGDLAVTWLAFAIPASLGADGPR